MFFVGIGCNVKPEVIRATGIPKSAFWAGKENEMGHWFEIKRINNHKNKAHILIYSVKKGELISNSKFMIICPINELKFIEDLEKEIHYFDGEKIQMKDNCYLQAN